MSICAVLYSTAFMRTFSHIQIVCVCVSVWGRVVLNHLSILSEPQRCIIDTRVPLPASQETWGKPACSRCVTKFVFESETWCSCPSVLQGQFEVQESCGWNNKYCTNTQSQERLNYVVSIEPSFVEKWVDLFHGLIFNTKNKVYNQGILNFPAWTQSAKTSGVS